MRRKWLCSGLAGAGLMIGLVVWLASQSAGQGPDKENGNGKKAIDPLPIRQVVLFNSGVGYFQREGTVDGNSRVDLSFPTSDVNDLLKSLILQDLGGGRISTVNYDSHDPIDKTLRSFAIDLNNNPTFGQLLNQARGEKIEITRVEKKDAQPAKLQGTIIGMETQRKPVGDKGTVEIDLLNLNTAAGLQSVNMEQILAVRFLNPVLESEFQRALKILAGSHDTMKKTVSLGFNGAGPRPVRVGYVVERPIWKTTYRLRMDANGKVYLQGWALVENSSDDDWNDVRMVLVSGKPISYQMNLYEPIYIPRPFVEPEYFASLRPPVYSGALEPGKEGQKMPPGQGAGMFGGQGMMGGLPPPVTEGGPAGRIQGFGGGFGGGFQGFGGFQGGFQGGFGQNPFANFGMQGGGFNGWGFNGGWGMFDGNRYQQPLPFGQNTNPFNKLTYDELQARREQQAKQKGEAKDKGAAIAMNFKEGIQSVATSEEVGDYYQYILDQKISLGRQKSAMLPILEQNIDGHKVSIYNEATHAKYPLLGLRLKNTSNQPLTQGPITVYDAGIYAGDTRILDMQPKEERLLSYALDQSTEVKTGVKSIPSPEMNFKIGEAKLTATYKLQETKTYTIKNRSTHDRQVIVEHPIRKDWKLLKTKPAETSRNVYRFKVDAPAGETATLEVVEEQARVDNFALTPGGTAPHYAVGLGIEVKEVTHLDKEQLTGLRIQKGFLQPTYKVKQSKTYFVQNLSEQKREFRVDHIIPRDWVRADADDKSQRGPDVYRFTLNLDKGNTGQKEVIEERTYTDKSKTIKDFSETKIKEFLNSAVPSADVKAGLTKALAMEAKITEAGKSLANLEKQFKIAGEDQARVRSNLQVIPQSNPAYQKFLDKFLAQETQIEDLQRQIRATQATLATQEREFEAFIAALNAE
jgi:hypothetical protein